MKEEVYNPSKEYSLKDYTLDLFEKEFNEAQSETEKTNVFNRLLDSDIDFADPDNRERLVEYRAQLQDYREELKIESDYLINLELEMFPGKWQLYTCIKPVYGYNVGHNYYVKIDDLAKQYNSDELPDAIANYVNNINALIWVVTDNGIGTLKSKHLWISDVFGKFDEHFTKYEN